jgi:hypothetical protein
MTGIDLGAIQTRADAATEGPWKYRDIIGENHNVCVNAHNIAACGAGDLNPEYGDRDQQAARNAEFIAHARADVPALIAAVRERDATIAQVRAHVDGAESWGTRNVDAGSLRAALDPQEGQ